MTNRQHLTSITIDGFGSMSFAAQPQVVPTKKRSHGDLTFKMSLPTELVAVVVEVAEQFNIFNVTDFTDTTLAIKVNLSDVDTKKQYEHLYHMAGVFLGEVSRTINELLTPLTADVHDLPRTVLDALDPHGQEGPKETYVNNTKARKNRTTVLARS